MSRELKFRVWDTGAKCYVKDPVLFDNFGQVYVVCEETSDKRGTCLITHKPNIVKEQYTGLKDKCGKEIYEGDIVLVANQGRTPYVVIYREGDCSFVCDNEFIVDYVHLFKALPQCYEVIGNIHENAELLEKE